MGKTAFIITLTGSSGCGKSHFTDKIIEFGKELRAKEGIQFNPKPHWKYVTRSYRETEIIDKEINKKEIDVKSVKAIPEDCEFIYRTYGDEYGFYKKDLQKYLDQGESPVIVINDVRVVEELKKEFPDQVLSLFLFREIIPDVETHKKAGQSRGGVSESKSISRFEKAVALYRVFIENIFLFDRVILNVPYEGINANGEKFEDIAKRQAKGVIRGVINGKIPLNKKITKTPKLFIVSGNAQSGKDDIIRAAKKLGRQQTDILIKYTNRKEEDGDDGEIICKYKPKESLVKQYEEEYALECNQFDKDYTLEKYMKFYKRVCEEKYIKYEKKVEDDNKKKRRRDKKCTYEKFCEALYDVDKNIEKSKIKTKLERFWESLKKDIEDKEIPKGYKPDKEKINKILKNIIDKGGRGSDFEHLWKNLKNELYNPDKKELPENVYKEILSKYFDPNSEFIDLEKIVSENKELYKEEIKKIDQRISKKQAKPENNSGCLQYKGKPFVLYENNKKLFNKQPTYYGYEIDKYVEQLKNGNKHIVLTASLPNMFRICREHFGQENVITAYTYSQINQEEHAKHSDKVTGEAKLQEYDDILRYAYYIEDFDYALIFAETSLTNESGGQRDELIDQMFRLFRYYNSDVNKENKNKLFVLSGPSATGKSTLLKRISDIELCEIAPKYSSRKIRENLHFDDIIHKDRNYIEENCTVKYEMYGNLYGFNPNEIEEKLYKKNQITICNNIDSIKKIIEIFDEKISIIFIYLQNIQIENLLKAYIERKNLKITKNKSDKLFSLANKLSESLKTENKFEFNKHEEAFKINLKEYLSNIDYKEFEERYNTMIYSNEYYIENKYLFNTMICGKNEDELFENCCKIIKEHTK